MLLKTRHTDFDNSSRDFSTDCQIHIAGFPTQFLYRGRQVKECPIMNPRTFQKRALNQQRKTPAFPLGICWQLYTSSINILQKSSQQQHSRNITLLTKATKQHTTRKHLGPKSTEEYRSNQLA